MEREGARLEMRVSDDFEPILRVADIMNGFPAPWFISGGWAIDLFLGEVTRVHSDVEIGIFRRDQQAVRRQLPGWALEKAVDSDEGGKSVSWEASEELQLPVHQIKASQCDAQPTEIEFFLNERSDADWISRRHEGLTRPISQAIFISAIGVPALAPEIQLLFKGKYNRQKDQFDFERAITRFRGMQRNWLATALTRYHARHPWIAMLSQIGCKSS